MLSTNTNPFNLVTPELRVKALQATYNGVTLPVDLHSLHEDGLQGPTTTKKRGRPKHKRIPSQAETNGKRVITCGICGKRGHNKRTCKAQVI